MIAHWIPIIGKYFIDNTICITNSNDYIHLLIFYIDDAQLDGMKKIEMKRLCNVSSSSPEVIVCASDQCIVYDIIIVIIIHMHMLGMSVITRWMKRWWDAACNAQRITKYITYLRIRSIPIRLLQTSFWAVSAGGRIHIL